MKEQTFSDNHNDGDERGIYSHPKISAFTDTLLAELEERSAVLLRNSVGSSNSKVPDNYAAYHCAGRDIVDLSTIALSDWLATKSTTRGLRNITLRLCSALMNLEFGIGLCSNRSQWKPPMRTMQILAGLSGKS